MLERLKNFPISFFSIALGLAGFSLALSRAEQFGHWSMEISQVMRWFAFAVFALIAMIYVAKALWFRKEVKEELAHPVRINFFPLVAKLLLVFAIIFMHQLTGFARVLWILGVIAQSMATVLIVNRWFHNDSFSVSHISPAIFMPIVGNMLIPIAGVEFAPKEFSWFFYSIGIVFWIVMFTIVANRLFFHQAIPEKLVPTLFILMAPPAIGTVAYIRLTGSFDVFARVQYYFALFMVFLLLSQIRVFLRLRFYLSWWAYTFPLAAVTTASLVVYHKTGWDMLWTLAIALLATLAGIIALLTVRTTRAVSRTEICVMEH